MKKISRRSFIIGTPLILVSCTKLISAQKQYTSTSAQQKMYGAVHSEPHFIPAVNLSEIDPRYYRQVVNYNTSYAPGTIVVDTSNRFLYLVQNEGKAIRYGVGVGREGFLWRGSDTIRRKAQWPSWTPTSRMIGRDHSLVKYAGGMPPGIDNPLGARALYLYEGGRDTNYRLHGSNEPWSIGHAVSSGCIRLINQDIIDLYNRVDIGTQVIVM